MLSQTEIKYVVHVFTSEVIKPDPKKIEAIINMLVPKDGCEVKSF